jgi:hypothetical protein
MAEEHTKEVKFGKKTRILPYLTKREGGVRFHARSRAWRSGIEDVKAVHIPGQHVI